MCGIIAVFTNQQISTSFRNKMLLKSKKIRHRGPDASGCYQLGNNIFLHERLSIIDPNGGAQPIVNPDNGLILCVNGEIYTHSTIRERYNDYSFQTGSDCEAISALYYNILKEQGDCQSFLNKESIQTLFTSLNGQFAFVLYDQESDYTLVGRDPFGVAPLYYGHDREGRLYFSSELKALDECICVKVFPAGHFAYFQYDIKHLDIIPENYFNKEQYGKWITKSYDESIMLTMEHEDEVTDSIHRYFTNSVIKRLMTDVPFGILLSGGLDSSLVASVAQKYLVSQGNKPSELHTFSIGLEGSPDLAAAKKVADFLGTTHHNFIFTVQEALDFLEDVIYHLETYDITTIRASTPMFLLARRIKALGFKMVLSGEGSDELLGGYLYFHQAPNNQEHRTECQRRLLDLGYFDCLRANKSTMAWGLEARVPFLDKEFVNLCIDIHKDLKGTMNFTNDPKMEKYVIRKAFDINDENGNPVYLPRDVLWRQKEQFSDGVGYNWIDTLKQYTQTQVESDADMLSRYHNRFITYPFNTPDSMEAFYYREIFERFYPLRATTVKKWIPKTEWEGVGNDPSGRAQSTHDNKT